MQGGLPAQGRRRVSSLERLRCVRANGFFGLEPGPRSLPRERESAEHQHESAQALQDELKQKIEKVHVGCSGSSGASSSFSVPFLFPKQGFESQRGAARGIGDRTAESPKGNLLCRPSCETGSMPHGAKWNCLAP